VKCDEIKTENIFRLYFIAATGSMGILGITSFLAICIRRSTDSELDTCIVPLTNTRLGRINCAVAGPRLWNSLPAELSQLDIELGEFRLLLITSSLGIGDTGAWRMLFFVP